MPSTTAHQTARSLHSMTAKGAQPHRVGGNPPSGDAPVGGRSATETKPNAYDSIPYCNSPHPASHPRKLEAMATLFGMTPPPVPQSRVLEIGCASGWNIIPVAVDYPESFCTGLDLSETQISEGQAMIQSLRLKNIELRQANIMAIDASWGQFDYIVCHGIYSWVPEEVRSKIMAVCRENLSANGVAYISYNVLPGWRQRGTIRDMMLYHAEQVSEPREKIARAREVLDFMAENCLENTPYGSMLKEELDMVRKANDEYLFHDHLEEHNHPVYFFQFLEQATTAGMQYLGDASFSTMLPKSLGKKASASLAEAPLEKQEQYMDFLRNRMFRCSLLCHADIPLNRGLHHGVMNKFHISLTSRPEPDSLESFQDGTTRLTLKKGSLATKSKLGRATIETLVSSWPCAVTIEEIYSAALAKGEDDDPPCSREEGLDAIASGVMEAFASGVLDISVHPPKVVDAISERPVLNPWVRKLAELDGRVTDQNHKGFVLDDFSRFLAQRLDGRHDRKGLIDSVLMAVDDGRLSMKINDQTDKRAVAEEVPRLIDIALGQFRENALLIA